MKHISENTYKELANDILNRLDGRSYLCDNFMTDEGSLDVVLIAYYDTEEIPEGDETVLMGIDASYWHFSECTENGIPVETDFSFDELTKYI